MNVLLLAPQPFFAERGTPIAVRLLAEELCAAGHAVDLLCYHEGADVAIPGLRLHRARRPPLVREVPIGFSWQKLACDVFLVAAMRRLLRHGRYDVVHAVEEAVFPAAFLGRGGGAAVVWDLDSDMVEQVLAKHGWLRPLRGALAAVERAAMRRCRLALAVCPSLAGKARALVPGVPVRVLEDVPLAEGAPPPVEDLRATLGVAGPLALYVGNLEPYQGIDLLLGAMAEAGPEPPLTLVVIGGGERDRARYGERAAARGLDGRVRFAGPRPVRDLGGYLAQADILVSPRVAGENTPMKIYSYLAAGRAILATDIASHTQALDASCALLVRPEPGCLAAGLRELAADPARRAALGERGARVAAERFSRRAYRAKLREAYALLGPEGRP